MHGSINVKFITFLYRVLLLCNLQMASRFFPVLLFLDLHSFQLSASICILREVCVSTLVGLMSVETESLVAVSMNRVMKFRVT